MAYATADLTWSRDGDRYVLSSDGELTGVWIAPSYTGNMMWRVRQAHHCRYFTNLSEAMAFGCQVAREGWPATK